MVIDDLSPKCDNTFLLKYSDDVNFLHFFRLPNKDFLQSEFDNVVEWFRQVGLPLNMSKCVTMNFITKRNVSPEPIFDSCGNAIQTVTNCEILGVCFSDNLKQNVHFEYILSKTVKRLYVIRNLKRSSIPKAVMINAYFAFIRSLLL